MAIKVHFGERRSKERQQSYKLLPLSLIDEKKKFFIPAQLADVSSRGIGIVTTGPLPAGHVVRLQMLRMELTFEVAWCREEANGEYICGLVLSDESLDLETMFRGLLRDPMAS